MPAPPGSCTPYGSMACGTWLWTPVTMPAPAAQGAELGHLPGKRLCVVGLFELKLDGDDIRLGGQLLDQGEDGLSLVVIVTGAGLLFGRPGSGRLEGECGDKGESVAVVLPQQRAAGFLDVEAAAVDGYVVVAIELERAPRRRGRSR